MSSVSYTAPAPSGVLRLPRLSRGGAQVALFILAYLVYSGARYFTIGDLGDATANAHWIVDLENTLGVGIESAVQTALNAVWGVMHQLGGTTDLTNPGPGDVYDEIAPVELPED